MVDAGVGRNSGCNLVLEGLISQTSTRPCEFKESSYFKTCLGGAGQLGLRGSGPI